jgi:hypothetical protein
VGGQVCADDIVRAGWPLQFYEESGLAYRSVFSLSKLSLDLGIWVLLSGTVGWMFKLRIKQNP